MTAAQLHHLAELAAEAADYCKNPAWSERLTAAAAVARRMADEHGMAEARIALGGLVEDIESLMHG